MPREIRTSGHYPKIDGFKTYLSLNRALREKGQGLKIHVSSWSSWAQIIADTILPILRRRHIPHKIVPTMEELDSLNEDRTQAGKFITIYPRSPSEWIMLLRELEGALIDIGATKYCGPPVPTDQHITNVLYSRFGGFTGDWIKVGKDWLRDDRDTSNSSLGLFSSQRDAVNFGSLWRRHQGEHKSGPKK